MVKRPLVRYHGGKFLLSNWIISHFPPHRGYTETFGGGGSILLRKERSYFEVYNDLDDEIVNLFRVARDFGSELRRSIELTPFSRVEHSLSYEKTEDVIEQARRTVVRSFLGFSSASASRMKSGFRANSNRSGTTPAHDWMTLPAHLDNIIDRMKGVVIENKDAKKVLIQHDNNDVLHYIDPPYIKETRSSHCNDSAYIYELSTHDHEELINFITELQGYVVLSGYENDMYNDLLKGWRKEKKETFADGGRPRLEILWISPNTPMIRKNEINSNLLF